MDLKLFEVIWSDLACIVCVGVLDRYRNGFETFVLVTYMSRTYEISDPSQTFEIFVLALSIRRAIFNSPSKKFTTRHEISPCHHPKKGLMFKKYQKCFDSLQKFQTSPETVPWGFLLVIQ